MSGSITRAHYEKMQDPEVLAGPVPRDAQVSSLGVLERHIQHSYGAGDGNVVIRDFKFGIEVVVGYSMFFFTFRDQLRLIYSFNEASGDPENIQTYLEDMQNTLEDKLRAQ